ncbi:hypothetical protein HN51_049973 [Arachis hypogaea]|uniref:Uncharacterized protein n=1 Tax=Arachis hypogaea TaxID=3818 RepID=A0A444YDA4_ARAHY|nr:hypothetical protein Ahy_B07g087913 [Arachis hypogaea]
MEREDEDATQERRRLFRRALSSLLGSIEAAAAARTCRAFVLTFGFYDYFLEMVAHEHHDDNDEEKMTPFLVAAKYGIVELVEEIQSRIPSAIYNPNLRKRNVLLIIRRTQCCTWRQNSLLARTVSLEREDEDDDNEETKSDNQDSKENQIFKLEILAGNARKVSAVRFERINGEDEMLEAKEVTHFVPKIVKRKWNNGEDSDDADYDGDAFAKRPQHEISSDYIDDQENSDRD